jgi:membrane protein DedA with SNARE-associated domain
VHIDQWLPVIPPLAVYLLVMAMVGIESLGIPVPGETALIAAALLSSTAQVSIAWGWVAVAGAVGAIAGDAIGYALGRRYGRPLFEWLGGKFPRHFGPDHVAYAEHVFARWGAAAVLFGRWVALLRIFAGPLAGALRMPYWRFLLANAAGALSWAFAVSAAVHYLGVAAETALSRFSYLALLAGVLVGMAGAIFLRKRMNTLVSNYAEQHRAGERADAGACEQPAR